MPAVEAVERRGRRGSRPSRVEAVEGRGRRASRPSSVGAVERRGRQASSVGAGGVSLPRRRGAAAMAPSCAIAAPRVALAAKRARSRVRTHERPRPGTRLNSRSGVARSVTCASRGERRGKAASRYRAGEARLQWRHRARLRHLVSHCAAKRARSRVRTHERPRLGARLDSRSGGALCDVRDSRRARRSASRDGAVRRSSRL
jgi:hypothetical protein